VPLAPIVVPAFEYARICAAVMRRKWSLSMIEIMEFYYYLSGLQAMPHYV
jgi:hypothetical protein